MATVDSSAAAVTLAAPCLPPMIMMILRCQSTRGSS